MDNYIAHYGVKGMKWGIRKETYINPDYQYGKKNKIKGGCKSMREIKCLVEEMIEELSSAKEYAMSYTKYKQDDMPTAKKYMEMAKDELKHAMYLHDIVVAKIDGAIESGMDAPEFMRELWDEQHKCYIERYANVQYILEM